jgi:phosphatidylserine decarboxylase
MQLIRKIFRVFMEAFCINVLLLAAGGALTAFGYPAAALPFWLLFLFVMFFFRDPERCPPAGRGLLLSTADGKVMRVTRGRHPSFTGTVYRVLIFMSPLDVHRNRAPFAGTVKKVEHIPGRFLPAYGESIETENERNLVVFSNGKETVHVTQIAGILARRIVCRVDKGQRLAAGEEFGLIRFGSANELVFPVCYKPEVEPGSVVRAGTTVLARKKS